MSTAVAPDVDLDAWAEEARACEHSAHGSKPRDHADGGECWVMLACPCACTPPEVIVFCGAFIEAWARPGFVVRCACGRLDRPGAFYRVIGPVAP